MLGVADFALIFFPGIKISLDNREGRNGQEKQNNVLNVINDPGKPLPEEKPSAYQCKYPNAPANDVVEHKETSGHVNQASQKWGKGSDDR